MLLMYAVMGNYGDYVGIILGLLGLGFRDYIGIILGI